MRFLVDENLPEDTVDELRGHGHDALYVPDAGLRGAPDIAVWEYAASERMVLVTRDLDFPLQVRPAPAGLVLLRLPQSFRRTQIVAAVRELAATPAFQRLEGAITVASPGRVRRRPMPNA